MKQYLQVKRFDTLTALNLWLQEKGEDEIIEIKTDSRYAFYVIYRAVKESA